MLLPARVVAAQATWPVPCHQLCHGRHRCAVPAGRLVCLRCSRSVSGCALFTVDVRGQCFSGHMSVCMMALCPCRCAIDWKKGKNVTVKTIKKKQKHKGRGTVRTITKQVPNDSFFNFFSPLKGEWVVLWALMKYCVKWLRYPRSLVWVLRRVWPVRTRLPCQEPRCWCSRGEGR